MMNVKRRCEHGALGEKLDQTRGGQIKDVFGVNVSDFVCDDCQHFVITQTFDQLRVEHDHGTFDAAGERVDDRVLLHKQLRHVHAQRRAGDL